MRCTHTDNAELSRGVHQGRATGRGVVRLAHLHAAWSRHRSTRDRSFGQFVCGPADHQLFEYRQRQLNQVLVLCGMELGADGLVRARKAATTLTEAHSRASRLQAALQSRGVHPDVLTYCRSGRAELLQENYFHAVLEAMKSIAAKIRALTGLTSDGAALAQEAFSMRPNGPLLAINSLETQSAISEQKGFVNLLVGMFGVIRNPVAHVPRIEWEILEQDALGILTMASLVHRKLDAARAHRGSRS